MTGWQQQGQKCPHCGEWEMFWYPTSRPHPDEPGEVLSVQVCRNCDNGCDQLDDED